MNETLLIIAITIAIGSVAALVWLAIEHKKLKQNFNILSSCVERNNKDIAGLCSAAVSIDTKLSDSSDQLKDIAEKVTDINQYDQQPASQQPYHDAIQRVREGVSVEALMQQCNLSRDEATLLIRLHG